MKGAAVSPAAQVGHGVLEGGVLADAEGVDEAPAGRCGLREPVLGRHFALREDLWHK